MQFNIQVNDINKLKILKQALLYLGYKDDDVPLNLWEYLYKGFDDIYKNSIFRLEYDTFPIQIINEALKYTGKTSQDLNEYLKNCSSFVAICCTLGMEQELFCRRIIKTNMSYAVTLDSIASAFLEYACDEFQNTLQLKNPTFRFAPGYGDIPLELNNYFATVLNVSKKNGVTITDGNLFLPQKSMLGLIGLQDCDIIENIDRCKNCVRKNDCTLQKEGLKCYSQKKEKIC